MELATLSWLQLSALLGVGSLAAVSLYLLRLRRRRVEVPFIRLWVDVNPQSRSTRLFARLRRLLSLLIALCVVSLLAFAVAGPVFEKPTGQVRPLVILIDRGATMGASLGERTRLAEGLRRVRQRLDSLSADERALVAVFDSSVTALTPMTRDGRTLGAALEKVRASHLPSRLGPALRFAADTLFGSADGRVLLVSDGLKPLPDGPAGALARTGVELEHWVVGEAVENLAITAFASRRYPLDKNRSQVLVEVANGGRQVRKAELHLLADGQAVEVEPIEVEPGGVWRKVYSDVTGVSHALEARLLGGTQEAFTLDDRAYAVVPDRRRARVLCVTTGNLYLEAALLLDEYLDVDVVQPQAFAGGEGYEVLIFDGHVPPGPPQLPGIYLYPESTREEPFPLRVLGEVKEPYFDVLQRDHPILRWMALSDVNISRAKKVELQPGDRMVGGQKGAPLIVEGARGGVPFTAFTFDLRDSDLPLRVAWPLLLLNTVDLYTQRGEGLVRSHPVGRSLQLAVPATASSVQLLAPDGSERSLHPREGHVEVHVQRTGHYRLSVDGSEQLLAFNLHPDTPVALSPRLESATGSTNAQAADTLTASTPLAEQPPWLLLSLLAAALLVLEWLTHQRRWTV